MTSDTRRRKVCQDGEGVTLGLGGEITAYFKISELQLKLQELDKEQN